MNKKRIAQILTVLILLSNVDFQPNLIYADEVGNENVVSGSNLEEEEETGKEIELGTINLDYYPNKYSPYSKRNYLSEAEKTVIKFGKEKLNKDFYISDALFENNKVCYKLIIKNASDDYFPYGNNDSNSEYAKNNYRNYDFDKNDRNKYIVYINAPNNSAYFDPKDFSEHDYYNMNVDKIQNMIEKSLSQKFSNFNYNLKLNLEKQPEYKNGLKIVYASEGEDESGNVDGTLYKLYFKPLTLSKTLNEYIDETNAKPFFVSENEILENKISDENLNKINEILNNFNKNILFNVNLKIEDQSIKKENISNNNIQYYINVKNEIDETNKKLIISYNKKPELLETYNITEKINVNQNHNFNYYGFDFYQNEDLITNWYKNKMVNIKDFVFLSKIPKKENNQYYYEVKITDSNESDEHDISDMPDSNDGFNDGSDDIHYDGNEDYSFLNEMEETNKIEELGIIKKDILFENTFYYNEQDKKYYTSNLNEKIKNYLISKNIDSDKVVFSKIEYDKNKNLFFCSFKILKDGQIAIQYEFLPNEEHKLYFDTNYYYLTLPKTKLMDLTEDNYKNKIFNHIKREYNFKTITNYSNNNDIKEDTDLNKLYIQATVTTESNENKNIKIYFDTLAIPTILNENYDEKFSLSENEIENQELNEENTNKLKNLIKTLKNPLVNKDLNINEPVKIEKEIVNTETNINKTRYYVVANSSDGNKHKIFLEEKNNEIDNTDYDDISDENVDNLPYFYQSKEVYYSYYFKRKYDNPYSSSLILDRNDYEKLLTYTREIFNKKLEFDTQNHGPRIYFGKKMAYINVYDSELNKLYKIPIKGPEKLIFNSSCFNIPKDKEIPEDIMNKITNWHKENIINMKDIVFMNRNIQSETVDGKVQYYYDIEITKNNGSKKQDKLYLKTNSEYDNKNIYEEKVNNLIYLDSSIFKNQRKLNEKEKENVLDTLKNEIADNIMNGVDYFEIQNDDVNKDENGYYIDLIVNTLKNETFNVKLYIYEKEDITLKTLIPISNINIDNLYIDNNHTYVYQFGGQNDYGIPIKKYIENKLENGETISSIEKNIVNGKQGISFIINKNGNYSRTINVIVEKEMNISDGMKFGGQTHPILLENSAINRKTNESDKESILKMLRQIYPAAIKDINIVSNISMKYVYSSELDRNFLVDTPYVIVQIIPYGDEINENINIEKYKNGFELYDDLIGTKDNNYLVVFVNESPLPKPACPPSIADELGTPVIECKISNSSGCCGCGNPNKPIVPVDPNDYPNVPNIPDPPKPENPVTPSDLPKPKPNNPTTPTPKTPNTVVPKEPNTIVPKKSTPITIITNKTNEDVTNKNDPTTLSETKTVTRNIKTGDNLFFMLSLFSGMLSLFSFIFIFLNKRKRI